MLMFLYNIGMTIWKAGGGRRRRRAGGGARAGRYPLPARAHQFDNYTVSIFYRWWTIHLWVEGVWEMIQAGLLAYLLIRLSGADREVMEKWLYVIVGLVFIAGILGTAHHYYWVGVPAYWLPIGGLFSALEPLALFGMAMYAYFAMRRSGFAHPNKLALHWTIGSAVFTAFGAGLLGLAHTWPAVNKWTHGTLITPMHGHSAFFGAYVMIVLAIITYALPHLTGRRARRRERSSALGVLAPGRRHVRHDAGVRTAGIAQTYLERIMGLGYLETQLKIQVHFLMLVGTGIDLHGRRGAVPVRLLPRSPAPRRRRLGGRPAQAAATPALMSERAPRPASRSLPRSDGADRRDGLRYPGRRRSRSTCPSGDEVADLRDVPRRGSR
jgi:nitric oxide reductase subunit B